MSVEVIIIIILIIAVAAAIVGVLPQLIAVCAIFAAAYYGIQFIVLALTEIIARMTIY